MSRLIPLLCIAFALATMGAEGCTTEPTTKDEPDASAPTTSDEPEAEEPKAKKTPKPKKAGIGDSIKLTGTSEDLQVRVKVVRLRDPLAGGEFDTAEAGTRYVGVEVLLENVGSETYDDSPSNGAVVVYGDDEQASPTLLTGGPCQAGKFSSVRIAPGGKRRGCIPFEVPSKRKMKLFQFTLDSGFADEGGEWVLR